MPKAKTLQEFIQNKKDRYKITDIVEIDVPEKVVAYARKIAPLLDSENEGEKTRDGGKLKHVKGTIGQWAVHKYLTDNKWEHTYSKPYVSGQHGDQYDILFGDGSLWDVKCREWWKPDYFYNIKLMMGVHEKENFKTKRVDQYIFTTVSKDFSKAYILGGIDGFKLWDILDDLTEDEEKYTKYPTQGKIFSRHLKPILKVILRT